MALFNPANHLLQPASTEAYHFVFCDGRLLLPADEAAPFLPLASGAFDLTQAHYLGRLGQHDCWSLTVAAVPEGFRAAPLRAAMMALPNELMMIAARAGQIIEWDRAHRFCGVCGTATVHKSGERARVCPSCGHLAYPRISPAMMCLVWREGEVLLARSPNFTPGVYSALAGFVEPGESLEECVEREVKEEVGVDVVDLQYYGSQNWPFPHSLMLAFSARWCGGDIVPQPGEIEHAAWFALDALPPIPPRFSISGYLIRDQVKAMGGPDIG
ncbi:NAD(+) diphosphatase [Chitinimonas sp.]|uniref:NAD(+) diphosphatase n=1 Tax=Chitinimonas sp. TaxID=1934313 RepID=UPI0035B278EC